MGHSFTAAHNRFYPHFSMALEGPTNSSGCVGGGNKKQNNVDNQFWHFFNSVGWLARGRLESGMRTAHFSESSKTVGWPSKKMGPIKNVKSDVAHSSSPPNERTLLTHNERKHCIQYQLTVKSGSKCRG